MNSNRRKAVLRCGWLACAGLAALSLAVPAQAAAKKYDKFQGQIISVSKIGIMVRGQHNYSVRSFTYTQRLSAHVAKNLANPKHAYHVGEIVEIVYVQGSDIAAKIKHSS